MFNLPARLAGPLAAILLTLAASSSANAALVVAYDTSSNPLLGQPATESGTLVLPGPLTRGLGLAQAPGNHGFSSRGWDTSNNSFADAIADGEILTWGWVLSPLVNLSTMDIGYSRNNQGPQQLRIDLAINGGGFSTVYTDTSVSTSGETVLGIDLSSFTNVFSATFRLVAFDAGNSNGRLNIENFQSGPGRGIAVYAGPATPEASAVGMMVVALIGLTLLSGRYRSISTWSIPVQKWGRSSGLRLLTKWRSMTTGASSQTAPALMRSSLMPGEPVTRMPL